MPSTESLPFDTRPLPESDLLPEDKEVLSRIEAALLAIVEDADGYEKLKPRDDLRARPDPQRRPRVMMIDGERGTGKTSLLLTLLDAWQSGVDCNKQERSWSKPQLRKALYALDPLDFDPMPPGLPLLAWVVQAFEPLVEHLMNGAPGLGPGVVQRLNHCHPHGELSLRNRWHRLHDDAAVAWQDPTRLDSYGANDDQLRRVRAWGGFQKEWRKFLDVLFDLLQRSSATKPSVLVLPIDDVDMQITRTPELIRVLRVLYHPRLVFLLTGHAAFLEHVLDQGLLGQVSNLTGGHLNLLSMGDMGQRMREKVIRDSLCFHLKRLTLGRALRWRNYALLGENSALERVISDQQEKIKDITKITFRQLSDILAQLNTDPTSIDEDPAKSRTGRLLALLVLLATPSDGASERRANIQSEGIPGLIRSLASGVLPLRMDLVGTWRALNIEMGPGTTLLALQNPEWTRHGTEKASEDDRWVYLWYATTVHSSGNKTKFEDYLNKVVQFTGPREGTILKSLSQVYPEGVRWPSLFMGDSTNDIQTTVLEQRWPGLHSEGLLEDVGFRNHPIETWIKFNLPHLGGDASGDSETLTALLKRVAESTPPVDVTVFLVLAHPAFGLPLHTAKALIDQFWPVERVAPPEAAEPTRQEPRRRAFLQSLRGKLEWCKLIDKEAQNQTYLSDDHAHKTLFASGLHTATDFPVGGWNFRAALEIAGPGIWASFSFGSSGQAAQANWDPSFSDPQGRSRTISMLLLRPTIDRGSLGGGRWVPPGFAAEAVGRLAIQDGWMDVLWRTTSPNGRRNQSASLLTTQVLSLIKENSSNALETSHFHLQANSVGVMTATSETPVVAYLNGASPTPFGTVDVYRGHRWSFTQDGSPHFREAICAWMFLSSDIAHEQGGVVSGLSVDHDRMQFLSVGGTPLPPPRFLAWSSYDRLRMWMEDARPPQGVNEAHSSTDIGLWWLVSYIEAVATIHLNRWIFVIPRQVEYDLDSTWKNNHTLLNIIHQIAVPEKAKAAKDIAQWWIKLSPFVHKSLGDRFSDKLVQIDNAARAVTAPSQT